MCANRLGGDTVKRSTAEEHEASVSRHALHEEPFSGLRMCQPARGGDRLRPNSMRVGQIEPTGVETVPQ